MSPWLRDPLARWRHRPRVLLLSSGQLVREWHQAPHGNAKADPLPFAEWCAQNRGKTCLVVAGADSLRAISPPPSETWPGSAAASAFARQMLAHYHGDEAHEWPLWLWHSAGDADPAHWGASALLPGGKEKLDAVARDHDVHVQALWPLWALALEQAAPGALANAAALVVHEPGWITGLDLQDGRLCRVAHRRVNSGAGHDDGSAGCDSSAVHSTLPRWAWATAPAGRLNQREIAPPNGPHVRLPGVTLQACPRPGQRERTPALAWLTLAGALAGTAVLTGDAWVARQAAVAAQLERARWQQAQATAEAALRPPAVVPAPSASAADNDGNSQQPLTRHLAGKLSHPWGSLLHAVESASDGKVQWLRLEHDAETSVTRLEASATDAAQAVSTAGRLKEAGPWRTAWLARLAPAKDAGGLRFEVEAVAATASAPAGERP